jgi:predicted metal-dependent peptidase
VPNVADHGGGIDVHLPGEISAADREELEDRVAAAVEAWVRSGRAGHVPGDRVQEIAFRRGGRVPWQALLRRFAGQAVVRDEYCLARPHRQYLEAGIVVPGRIAGRAGNAVVALDTSASMGREQLAAVCAEVAMLARSVEELTLIVADARVQEVVTGADLSAFSGSRRLRGGGGTDHRPVFAWIAEHRLSPEVFVGLTDLCSRFPDERPPYPVIWVVPRAHGKAPWGQVIELD